MLSMVGNMSGLGLSDGLASFTFLRDLLSRVGDMRGLGFGYRLSSCGVQVIVTPSTGTLLRWRLYCRRICRRLIEVR